MLYHLLLSLLFTSSFAKKTVAPEDPSLPPLSHHCLESEAMAHLGTTDEIPDGYCGKTIRDMMERGWWDVTSKLVKECRARDFKLSGQIYKAKSNLNKQLNIITNLLSGPSALISPAFQWSQSKDYILINVKFAHKLDTPATLGVKSKGADIKSTELVFEAASKSKNKRFKLSLQLARAIVPEESEWSMAAVGRATFSLKKKHPETAWVKLLNPSQSLPQNMHTWWAMKEQHENDVKSLDTSLTDASAIKMASNQKNTTEETAPENVPTPQATETPVLEDLSLHPSDAIPTEATIDPIKAALKLEKQKAREAILNEAKTASDLTNARSEAEHTTIQRRKAEALLNLDNEYQEKMDL